MSAEVIAYSADPWDTSLTLKVECLDCSMEWGWGMDRPDTVAKLERLAEQHNSERHP